MSFLFSSSEEGRASKKKINETLFALSCFLQNLSSFSSFSFLLHLAYAAGPHARKIPPNTSADVVSPRIAR